MHPALEKLIDLAIADGQITEKERNVILKKAIELGVDPDEVEVILEGKLHQLEASKPKQKEKVGSLKTCPACGSSLKAMDFVCSECGHEFQEKIANKSITDLIEKLEKEDNKEHEFSSDRHENKAKIITQFPIPQTKEDIFEFISFSFPFLENKSLNENEKKAWRTKASQAIMKAKFAQGNESDRRLITEFENKLDLMVKNEKKDEMINSIGSWLSVFLAFFVLYLMVSFIASWFGAKYWPFN